MNSKEFYKTNKPKQKETKKRDSAKKRGNILKKSSVFKMGSISAAIKVIVLRQTLETKDYEMGTNRVWVEIAKNLVKKDPVNYYNLRPELKFDERVVEAFLKKIKNLDVEESQEQKDGEIAKNLSIDKVFDEIKKIIRAFPFKFDELPEFVLKDENKKVEVIKLIVKVLDKEFEDEEEITSAKCTEYKRLFNEIIKIDEVMDSFSEDKTETKEDLKNCVVAFFEKLLVKYPEACEILPRSIISDKEAYRKLNEAFLTGVDKKIDKMIIEENNNHASNKENDDNVTNEENNNHASNKKNKKNNNNVTNTNSVIDELGKKWESMISDQTESEKRKKEEKEATKKKENEAKGRKETLIGKLRDRTYLDFDGIKAEAEKECAKIADETEKLIEEEGLTNIDEVFGEANAKLEKAGEDEKSAKAKLEEAKEAFVKAEEKVTNGDLKRTQKEYKDVKKAKETAENDAATAKTAAEAAQKEYDKVKAQKQRRDELKNKKDKAEKIKGKIENAIGESNYSDASSGLIELKGLNENEKAPEEPSAGR